MPMLARHGMPLLDAMAARAREHASSVGASSTGQSRIAQHAVGR